MSRADTPPASAERIRRELPHLSERQVDGLAWTMERLVETFAPERVYVFGSQARGTARPESDIDLLVLMPRLEEPGYRLAQRALEVITPLRVPIELIFMSCRHFEERQPALASLPATVCREGKLLYDVRRTPVPVPVAAA